MEFNSITTTLMIIVLILLPVGLVLLIRFEWFKGWVVGTIGLGSIAIAISCSIIILSFNSYLSSSASDSVATLSFKQIAPKKFEVELAETQGQKQVFKLDGDLWQVDATMLNWGGFLKNQGLKPYYRITRINSSYALLSDAERLASSSIKVENSLIDSILNDFAKKNTSFLLNSVPVSTGSLPMTDGALFSIRLNKAGLISKPENQEAFASIR